MKKYTYIDLFAGAGGLSLGFGNAGMELEFANDIAKEALDTFRHNLTKTHPKLNPERIIHGDITALYEHLGTSKVKNNTLGHKVIETDREVSLRMKAPDVKNDDIKRILSEIESVDILAGGPPCQGFSMIGRSKKANIEERMKGFVDDPRNQLFQYSVARNLADQLDVELGLDIREYNSKSEFKSLVNIHELKSGPNADQKLDRKEHSLRRKITTLESDVSTWKNNISFFSASKNADELLKDFAVKIEKAEQEILDLKEELKLVMSI